MMKSTSVRLGSFALVLAGTFGTAYAIGEKLPGHHHSGTAHNHSSSGLVFPVVPSSEMSGYQLITDKADGVSATFHLRSPDGEAVTDFASVHGALLHAVLIRPDLGGFQHVHPAIERDGSWTITMEPGQWHLVFESTPVASGTPVAEPIIVTADLNDGTVIEPVALPPPDDVVEIDGLVVSRDGFRFTVTNEDGSAATDLEPYLGQVAHLVAIRQDDLAFAHVHPLDSPAGTFDFGFATELGTYRIFLQFGHAGSVITVPFTVTFQNATRVP